jgi:hypothetical protein
VPQIRQCLSNSSTNNSTIRCEAINAITAIAVKQINNDDDDNNNSKNSFLFLKMCQGSQTIMSKISSHPFSKQLVHLPSILRSAAWKIHAMHLQPNATSLFQ